MSIRLIVDSASDMDNEARSNISILPMTVTFGDKEYKDGVNLSREEFYKLLIEYDELPVTSQISPYEFEEEYKKYPDDELIVITMSSKLSGTYQSACIAAQDYDNVHVVDSYNVTIGEHVLIEYAMQLIDEGLGVDEIITLLEKTKGRIKVVALLDTLEYLKKGGRISGAAALVGGILSIKPVISVSDGEVNMLGKARGSKQGNNLLIEQINACGGIDFNMPYYLAYSGLSDVLLKKYIEDSRNLWEGQTDNLPISIIGGTIGTHVGPGAVAVAFCQK